MTKYKTFYFLIVLIFFIFLIGGCEERFAQINASDFKTKWDDSIKHTALSWWYLGEKDGYYYILEKWPIKKYGYKIDKKNIVIKLDHPKKLTFNEPDWINLKKDLIDFNSTY